MNNNENLNNEQKTNPLPAQATGKQIKEHQEENRNKYQTEFNVYHDKNQLTKDSKIILYILGVIVVLIILSFIF